MVRFKRIEGRNTMQDIYKEPKEIRYGNAIICVYVPVLKEETRKRREANIQAVLRNVGKEMYQKGLV